MMTSVFEAYLSNQPERVKEALITLREAILEAAPHAAESINYGIPAFALCEGGKRDKQILIAGYKNHIGFYPHPDTIEAFLEDLHEYKFAKGSVQFPLSKPIPKELVMKMVKYRYKQIMDKMKEEV